MAATNEITKNKDSLASKLTQSLKKLYDQLGMLLILIALIVIMSLINSRFFTVVNLTNIIRQISFIAIIALGSATIIIISGIDLSPGSVMAFAAVVAASMAHPNQYPVIVPILAGVVIGALCGLINGFIISKASIPPFIVTLGMYTAARGAALLYTDGKPIGNFSKEFVWLGGGNLLGIPVPIVLLIIMSIFTYVVLNHTKLGRHIYALGGNEQAAIISGIDVTKIKILVFSYGGLLAALAGLSLSARIESGQPGLGVGYELDAIAAAVIGGTSLSNGGIGTVQGTIIGALIIGVINNGMDLNGVNSYWQQIVKGAIIVTAVLLDKQKNKKR